VKRRSTHSISSSLMRLMMSLALAIFHLSRPARAGAG
jgi:hypothetical protein